jgi:hypothetical protein
MLRSKKALTSLGNDVNLTIDNNKWRSFWLVLKKLHRKRKLELVNDTSNLTNFQNKVPSLDSVWLNNIRAFNFLALINYFHFEKRHWILRYCRFLSTNIAQKVYVFLFHFLLVFLRLDIKSFIYQRLLYFRLFNYEDEGLRHRNVESEVKRNFYYKFVVIPGFILLCTHKYIYIPYRVIDIYWKTPREL